MITARPSRFFTLALTCLLALAGSSLAMEDVDPPSPRGNSGTMVAPLDNAELAAISAASVDAEKAAAMAGNATALQDSDHPADTTYIYIVVGLLVVIFALVAFL